ncbi:MarR family winged helix-turn-helix transcriptional regulator [Pelagibius marinus]|uniref:MarR family winged helix-turn-helix transcriptional regulator n=1 Tax=Pelagibius marinus TaxID=2762760 RepID=UPI001872F4C7|nr:MarR family transcriptional regulator [Pelagibius marinus]
MKAKYLELIGLIERLHRQCLEVIKADLDRQGIRDLNNVQALILFNIGEEELSIGELTQRGYYLGSNVSYNVKKMVENGYLIQERSPHDRRSFHVRAADKGVEVFRSLSALFDQHSTQLDDIQISEEALDSANHALRRVQQFWSTPASMARNLSPAA